MESIGFLELNSIAKGIEAADIILKTADTALIFAKAVCPGKYNILFSGEVAAVQASMDAGVRLGGGAVVDSVVIPRVHPQVIQAVNQATVPGSVNAVGIMEFFSIASAVLAADAAAKAALLAEAAGQTLGEVVSINASNSYGGDYGIANTYAMDARSAKTAIVSGDVTVSASVTVVFAIK